MARFANIFKLKTLPEPNEGGKDGTAHALSLLMFLAINAGTVMLSVQGKRSLEVPWPFRIWLVLMLCTLFYCGWAMIRSTYRKEDGSVVRTYSSASLGYMKHLLACMLLVSVATPLAAYFGLLPGQAGPSEVKKYQWAQLPISPDRVRRDAKGVQVLYDITPEMFGLDRLPYRVKVYAALSSRAAKKWQVMTPMNFKGLTKEQPSTNPSKRIQDLEPPRWETLDYEPELEVHSSESALTDANSCSGPPTRLVEFSLFVEDETAVTLVIPLLARQGIAVGEADRSAFVDSANFNGAMKLMFFADDE
jgi:hypothetical protein